MDGPVALRSCSSKVVFQPAQIPRDGCHGQREVGSKSVVCKSCARMSDREKNRTTSLA
jgi:hypothetical protein